MVVGANICDAFFRCPHGDVGVNVFDAVIVVRTVIGAKISEVSLVVRTVVAAIILDAFLVVRTVIRGEYV